MQFLIVIICFICFPCKDPDDMMNLDVVLMQLHSLKGCWHQLGMALGVASTTLNDIASQCGSQEECMVEMIDAWLRGHRDKPTWRELARALEKINQSALSKAIKQVYITGIYILAKSIQSLDGV